MINVNETIAEFECWLDGPIGPCAPGVEFTGLAPGAHVFAVRGIDDTASAPSEFENYEWTIVAPAPPATSFTAGPPALTQDTSATFTFTGIDNVTPEEALTFECALDGDPFAACTSPFEVTALDPGLHTLEVRAIDASATADPSPAIYTWTVQAVDITAPNTTSSPDRRPRRRAPRPRSCSRPVKVERRSSAPSTSASIPWRRSKRASPRTC